MPAIHVRRPAKFAAPGLCSQRLSIKRLLFAGEHTCFAYFGYMEGALQSGKQTASDLLKAIFRRRNGMST